MSQPNILIFFSDQQRFDTTGIHGNPLDLTPNFDEMARRGTDLHYMFTPQPVCGPARAALQTGCYPSEINCSRNSDALPQGLGMAHYFNQAGYETSYIGKWHLADKDCIAAVPPEQRGGYQRWLAANLLEFVSDAYDTTLWDEANQPQKLPGYRVDAIADAAIRYLAEPKEKPFFLMMSLLEPHHQNHRDDYPAPFGYEKRYTANSYVPPDLRYLANDVMHRSLAGYYGMVKRIDEALGRILEALHSLNLLEDTVVIFASDHGNTFRTRHNHDKSTPFEAAIRVPAAIMGPGFNGGGRITELVSLLDIAPTLLDAAGIAVPDEMTGRSILPLVTKQSLQNEQDSHWRQDIMVQMNTHFVARALRTKRWKYSVYAPDKQPQQHRGSDTYEEQYLFDLQADPFELSNLIYCESHAAVADDLRQKLLTQMQAIGEAPAKIKLAERKRCGQRALTLEDMHERKANPLG